MTLTATNHAQITTALLQKYSLAVSSTWLSNNISIPCSGPNPPLQSLTQTALFRLLASDFTTSLSKTNPNSLFPTDINDINIKERKLSGDIPVQLLSVEDIGSSKWAQIEAIERVERGEAVRGREIVRVVDVDSSDARGGIAPTPTATTASCSGPHKYILQDANGTKVVAFDQEVLETMTLGNKTCAVGMKLLLKKGCVVRRGLLMMRVADVKLLGGKIEVWDEAWKHGTKKRLMDVLLNTVS